MGYTTDFFGSFCVTPTLKPEHRDYLKKFCETRRMKRGPEKAAAMTDPVREAAGLPIGDEGGFFTGGKDVFGQGKDESIVDYNSPPVGQPGLWCQWEPTDDGCEIRWDGGEKFYNYEEWIRYLVKHFFVPWGYTLDGKVEWRGEDYDDAGIIVIDKNEIRVGYGRMEFDFD